MGTRPPGFSSKVKAFDGIKAGSKIDGCKIGALPFLPPISSLSEVLKHVASRPVCFVE